MAVHDWLMMGGYAAYVWPAYGITAVVLGVLAAVSTVDYRRKKRQLDSMQAERGRSARTTEIG